MADEGQLPGQHVAGVDPGHDEDVRMPGHAALQVPGTRGAHVAALSIAQRPVDQSALDLAALRHLRRQRRVLRGPDRGIDRLDRRQYANARFHAERVREVDRRRSGWPCRQQVFAILWRRHHYGPHISVERKHDCGPCRANHSGSGFLDKGCYRQAIDAAAGLGSAQRRLR